MLAEIVLLGSFIILILLGVPISFGLGISSLLSAFAAGLQPAIIAQRVAAGMQSFPLLAIPLFILAGALMANGGVAKRMVDLAYVIVGPLPGGLAIVNCIDSMFFGGVSGSAVADVSSTGPMIIPMMVEKGYDKDFAVALTVASASQGIIIPPSHNMVIYAMVAGGVSVGKLFLAGYIPGILLGVALAIACYFIALKRKYPCEKRPPLKESLHIVVDGILALLCAAIIIVGIAAGIFTATEASAVAVLYAAFLGFFVFRELKLKKRSLANFHGFGQNNRGSLFPYRLCFRFWLDDDLFTDTACGHEFLLESDKQSLSYTFACQRSSSPVGHGYGCCAPNRNCHARIAAGCESSRNERNNLWHSAHAQLGYWTNDAASRSQPFYRLHDRQDNHRKGKQGNASTMACDARGLIPCNLCSMVYRVFAQSFYEVIRP